MNLLRGVTTLGTTDRSSSQVLSLTRVLKKTSAACQVASVFALLALSMRALLFFLACKFTYNSIISFIFCCRAPPFFIEYPPLPFQHRPRTLHPAQALFTLSFYCSLFFLFCSFVPSCSILSLTEGIIQPFGFDKTRKKYYGHLTSIPAEKETPPNSLYAWHRCD